MIYPEASLLVAAFSAEARSGTARARLADLDPSNVATGGWCETEVVSGLAVKLLRGEFTPAASDAVAAIRASAVTIPIGEACFGEAAELIRRSPRPLRTGDALHLAIARTRDATVWTLDKGMAEAGRVLGLGTRLLG